jgi:hypothetical protein
LIQEVVEVKRLVTIVAPAILVVGLVLLGLSDTVPIRWSSWPSKVDVVEAVLRDIPIAWVTEVEIIKYSEPFSPQMCLMRSCIHWPVRVYIIGDQRKEEREVYLYEDIIGVWRLGWRFMSPESPRITSQNEVISRASNSSASATITITMYAVGKEGG